MKEITLTLRIYGNKDNAIRSIETIISDRLKDLDVESNVSPTEKGWTNVTIRGEDEEFAANFLEKEYGIPVKSVETGEVHKGYISSIDDDGMTVDIGLRVKIPKISLKPFGIGKPEQIASRFGIIPYLPVSIEITGVDKNIEGEFTKEQVDKWWEWKKSGIDRVIVNSVTRSQLKAAIKKKGHARDIYSIERLGVMEHAVVCREGTDGPGIVAHIGPLLNADMSVIRSS
jgi:hypothetical protein